MDTDAFWSLIATSREKSAQCADQVKHLAKLLEARTPEEIAQFHRHFSGYLDESYRWDLWAVAYIVHGGCSDDSFEYFRCWLIGQGRDYFEAALATPERAADNVEPGEYADCEELAYAAPRAYRTVTGQEKIPAFPRSRPSEPAGVAWDEDKVEKLFPALAKRFEYGDV